MSHYTEGLLQAYLDQEVATDARAAVDTHVSTCSACADRLQELTELNAAFSAALQLGDVRALPDAARSELRVRARRPAWARLGSSIPLLRAALFVLGITAVGAAAVPGSLVQNWLVRGWRALSGAERQTVAAPVAEPAAQPVPAETPGAFYMTPAEGRVRVVLQAADQGTIVHVNVVDSERASIQGSWRSIRTRAGQMEIVGGRGDLRILLPRSVANATVEVDGKVYVSKIGEELKFHGPTAVGQDLIFRPGR